MKKKTITNFFGLAKFAGIIILYFLRQTNLDCKKPDQTAALVVVSDTLCRGVKTEGEPESEEEFDMFDHCRREIMRRRMKIKPSDPGIPFFLRLHDLYSFIMSLLFVESDYYRDVEQYFGEESGFG
jgi:hypothetical protein